MTSRIRSTNDLYSHNVRSLFVSEATWYRLSIYVDIKCVFKRWFRPVYKVRLFFLRGFLLSAYSLIVIQFRNVLKCFCGLNKQNLRNWLAIRPLQLYRWLRFVISTDSVIAPYFFDEYNCSSVIITFNRYFEIICECKPNDRDYFQDKATRFQQESIKAHNGHRFSLSVIDPNWPSRSPDLILYGFLFPLLPSRSSNISGSLWKNWRLPCKKIFNQFNSIDVTEWCRMGKFFWTRISL